MTSTIDEVFLVAPDVLTGETCALHFSHLLWLLVNAYELTSRESELSFPRETLQTKSSADSPKQLLLLSLFFGQLNSKSELSQRSINLPTRWSPSSRTKTHSYSHIKQTGPGLVSELRLYSAGLLFREL